MPPTTTKPDPAQPLRAAADILTAAAELHSATARAALLAIKTQDVTIVQRITVVMQLMAHDLNQTPARLATLRRES